MKIAILGSRGIPANYGGFETFAEFLSIGLAKRGVSVAVYCPSYHEYREKSYKGVRLVRIPNLDNLFSNRVLRAISNLVYDILSLVHVSFGKYEIVYMLGYASGPFLIIPRLFGKKVVVNPDGLEWKSGRWGRGAKSWLLFCEMIAARRCHVLIADAEPIRDHFRIKYGIQTACIPYGAESQVCDSLPPTEYSKKEYYLVVARLVPETSIPMIVEGFRKSNSSKILVIIGPIADKLFYEESVKPLLDDLVIYLGPIYDRPLLQSYRLNAFALLHGHASDGTNPSLLESMSLSSPVIAVRTPSNMDVLNGGDSIYFSSADELSDCINRLEASSTEELELLGERNRLRISSNYSWDKSVERHLEIFDGVLRSQ